MGYPDYIQQHVRLRPKSISAGSHTPSFPTVADNQDQSNQDHPEHLSGFACAYRLLQSDWKNSLGIILSIF